MAVPDGVCLYIYRQAMLLLYMGLSYVHHCEYSKAVYRT